MTRNSSKINHRNFIKRVYYLFFDLFKGLYYKIPLCCIHQFTWEGFIGASSAVKRAKYFNIPIGRFGGKYVPCNKCMIKFKRRAR